MTQDSHDEKRRKHIDHLEECVQALENTAMFRDQRIIELEGVLGTLRFQNDELKRRIETAETELRARQTKAAPKKRAASALSTNKKEGERILAKVRASIDAASRKGLQSTLAKVLGSRDGSKKAIDLYADALGVSWDDACDRIKQQHLTLRVAGQPYRPAR